MNIYKYKIVLANRDTEYIYAISKTEAIRLFSQKSGVPVSFIKKHGLVKNECVVSKK